MTKKLVLILAAAMVLLALFTLRVDAQQGQAPPPAVQTPGLNNPNQTAGAVGCPALQGAQGNVGAPMGSGMGMGMGMGMGRGMGAGMGQGRMAGNCPYLQQSAQPAQPRGGAQMQGM